MSKFSFFVTKKKKKTFSFSFFLCFSSAKSKSADSTEISRVEFPMVNEEVLAQKRASLHLDKKATYVIDDFSLIVPTPITGLDIDMENELKGNFSVVYK